MVKIASFDGTGSSGLIEISDCFSATYRQYQIRCMLYNDADTANSIQWYDATAAAYRTTNYYYIVGVHYVASGPTSASTTGRLWDGSYLAMSENNGASAVLPQYMLINVFDPFDVARNTIYEYDYGAKDATHLRRVAGSGYVAANLSLTGFKIYAGSGNYYAQSHGAVYGIKS